MALLVSELAHWTRHLLSAKAPMMTFFTNSPQFSTASILVVVLLMFETVQVTSTTWG